MRNLLGILAEACHTRKRRPYEVLKWPRRPHNTQTRERLNHVQVPQKPADDRRSRCHHLRNRESRRSGTGSHLGSSRRPSRSPCHRTTRRASCGSSGDPSDRATGCWAGDSSGRWTSTASGRPPSSEASGRPPGHSQSLNRIKSIPQAAIDGIPPLVAVFFNCETMNRPQTHRLQTVGPVRSCDPPNCETMKLTARPRCRWLHRVRGDDRRWGRTESPARSSGSGRRRVSADTRWSPGSGLPL